MEGREIAIRSARILDNMKANNILVYDLRKSTDISDYFVIGTVTGPAHMTGIVNEIVKDLKSHGEESVRCDNQNMSQWVLMDCVDCVIHLFSPELREYYSLESLWGDSDTLDWNETAGGAAAAADDGDEGEGGVAVKKPKAKPKAKAKRAPAKKSAPTAKRRAPAKAKAKAKPKSKA